MKTMLNSEELLSDTRDPIRSLLFLRMLQSETLELNSDELHCSTAFGVSMTAGNSLGLATTAQHDSNEEGGMRAKGLLKGINNSDKIARRAERLRVKWGLIHRDPNLNNISPALHERCFCSLCHFTGMTPKGPNDQITFEVLFKFTFLQFNLLCLV